MVITEEQDEDQEMKKVASFKKNSTEQVRFSIVLFRETYYLDIRVFFRHSRNEEYFPTRKGIRLPCELIPELEGALQKSREAVEKITN